MKEINSKKIEIKNKLSDGIDFKISPFKEKIKKTKPHKHEEYYELILLREGEGFHFIDTEKYVINSPELYFLQPGQLHYWQFTSIPKGYVILFKESEFSHIDNKETIDLLRLMSKFSRIKSPQINIELQLSDMLYNESQTTADHGKTLLHSLFKSLLAKIVQNLPTNTTTLKPANSMWDDFTELLTHEIPRMHKVAEFASALNTTPQNLNALCRKNAHKSASEIIQARIILEAKRHLLHTDNNVNEITDILHFSDTSNFIKFFRKHTGLTPLQFKTQYFQ